MVSEAAQDQFFGNFPGTNLTQSLPDFLIVEVPHRILRQLFEDFLQQLDLGRRETDVYRLAYLPG
ncbi:MAG TPA: hypothetical protein PKW42_00120 [bacterium]|nr:hypothetical protein [bacterium]HPP11117.1 hypothetical protein [bacterium]